jgi:hypothetical protein
MDERKIGPTTRQVKQWCSSTVIAFFVGEPATKFKAPILPDYGSSGLRAELDLRAPPIAARSRRKVCAFDFPMIHGHHPGASALHPMHPG